MRIYQGNNFTVSIPNLWQGVFDEEEQYDVLYNPDGPGELQLSAIMHDKVLSVEDLKNIAAEDIQGGARIEEIELGDFKGFVFDYDVDDEFWSEWYLASGGLMLFITYTCPQEDEGKETDEVELILGTLRYSRQGEVA
ncbi:MAG: hypothetical protein KDJ38_13255 [Gammaproteobacteria bacterium]|nr:hypothetical protein [Gammaproteobacteria bacterium]